MPDYQAHPSAIIDDGARIGADTLVWHFCHISTNCEIGERCSFGQNCFVAPGVKIGHDVKVQNNVSLYTGVTIEDDVFLGPSCVLTNVINPRSQVNRRSLYERTRIRRGATVGANATIVCGITLGRYCFIGAGAVVAADIPNYALVLGVPGRLCGWMSRHGHRLHFSPDGRARCPESGLRYHLKDAKTVVCEDLGQDDPLPDDLTTSSRPYSSFKQPRDLDPT